MRDQLLRRRAAARGRAARAVPRASRRVRTRRPAAEPAGPAGIGAQPHRAHRRRTGAAGAARWTTVAGAGPRGARAGSKRRSARMGDLEAERQRARRRAPQPRRSRATPPATPRARRATPRTQLALTLESQRAQRGRAERSRWRAWAASARQLDARLNELAAQLADGDAPVDGAARPNGRPRWTSACCVEKALAAARSALDGIDNELRGYEQTRQQRDAAVAGRSARRSAAQGWTSRRWRLRADQLSEADRRGRLRAGRRACRRCPEDADVDGWEKTARRHRRQDAPAGAGQPGGDPGIRRSSASARTTSTRRTPTSPSALETLEDAIRKIDRETRGRFKDTFDRVNAGVQELYPRLFGGGHAYLELTGEDLLDTGVAIMARPPGKRVSQHLAAVRRREGADRGGAGVRDLPAQSGAVLPARRGRRAAGRGQRRPLQRDGHRDERAGAVPVRHPQQGDDGSGQAAVRRDHARAGLSAAWCRWIWPKPRAWPARPDRGRGIRASFHGGPQTRPDRRQGDAPCSTDSAKPRCCASASSSRRAPDRRHPVHRPQEARAGQAQRRRRAPRPAARARSPRCATSCRPTPTPATGAAAIADSELDLLEKTLAGESVPDRRPARRRSAGARPDEDFDKIVTPLRRRARRPDAAAAPTSWSRPRRPAWSTAT